jgi:ATP-dependent RNA helicase DeaD
MNTFSHFSLPQSLFRVLEERNFVEPTPIQSQVIPVLLESEQDVIALAQTGTGKTAAFSLPLLAKINEKNLDVQVVILSPTRELALQTADDIEHFASYMKDIRVTALYGGTRIDDQIRSLQKGSQIVVGTPGRILDLLHRKVLKLHTAQWIVLDEADEMLNMGFIEDIATILQSTPKQKQTLLFSATMPKPVEQIARKYMRNPLRIEVESTDIRKMAISHQYMMIPAREKVLAFKRYKMLHPEMYGIVFCRTKRETQEVGDALLRSGWKTGILHGDIEQRHRTRIMESFKNKETKILVATDVAARGIDVEKLTHVVHFGVPDQVENYVHRSGRTGRANEKGISLVFANLREHHALKKIERICHLSFEEIPLPKRKELIQNEIKEYLTALQSDSQASKLAQDSVQEILKSFSQKDMREIAEKALLLAVEERVNKYLEEDADHFTEEKKIKKHSSEDMETLVISLGRKNDLSVPSLLGLINSCFRGERVNIGKIQIGDTKASFEVPPALQDKLCRDMSKTRYRNQKFSVYRGEEVKRSDSLRRKTRRKNAR